MNGRLYANMQCKEEEKEESVGFEFVICEMKGGMAWVWLLKRHRFIRTSKSRHAEHEQSRL